MLNEQITDGVDEHLVREASGPIVVQMKHMAQKNSLFENLVSAKDKEYKRIR